MKKLLKISTFVSCFTVLSAGGAFLFSPPIACSTDYEFQKSLVVKHIESKGWPIKYLIPMDNPDNSCQASFLYRSDNQHIKFVVVAGTKVTWWDFNERD
ncbi:hypothetical protein [Microbulbifer sp. TRSA007]|uniref:hypothetical protein n=1 Tax=unclassified Microbulbifer TaxID=2619833 RepID=UPI004039A0EE